MKERALTTPDTATAGVPEEKIITVSYLMVATRRVEEAVRDYPWQTIGIAVRVGR